MNTASENIVIRNCIIKEGHQLLAIGSELSAGIKNVYVHHCTYQPEDTPSLRNIVFSNPNEGSGGYAKNIYVENIKASTITEAVLAIETDVFYQWKDSVPVYEQLLTTIEGIHLKNIEVGTTDMAFSLLGD